ncbi:hypothetical protein L1987_15217 [Smallanthus sonchifolius]|uniref:Uncharacterized protein n=1 Tax=Smallanthus sonchifolius TaxID=185202 RepID=A0ACB9J744_9ASTR|nr:hypothetical protein L1987_15217 [Smallanthus sonchifolius]
MVSPEVPPTTAKSSEPASSPRISFSADFLDDANFICINPHDKDKEKEKPRNGEFEFLSSNLATPTTTMLTADELFFEGKLLPFWQKQCSEKLSKISLNTEKVNEIAKAKDVKIEEDNRMSWFIDEDPSPRPPKCTVLWRELLRLKKQRASSLSPSSSTSSSSSSLFDEDSSKKEKHVKRSKKVLERTRSAGIKIRPMVNLPACTQGVRSNSLPLLFSIRKGMLDTGKA